MKIQYHISLWIALLALFFNTQTASAGKKINEEEPEYYNNIRGKYPAIVFLGDSNVWLAGDDLSCEKSWATWLTKTLDPKTVSNYARSGATICNTVSTVAAPDEYTEVLDDNNTLYNQALRLKIDIEAGEYPDSLLVVIGCGTNDAWFADRRPGLFDEVSDEDLRKITAATPPSEATSLLSSARLITEMLMDAPVDAEIIYVSPTLNLKTSDEMVKKVRDVAGREFGYIDLCKPDIIDPEKEKVKFDMTTDGVHTSEKGAKKIAQAIVEIMVEDL